VSRSPRLYSVKNPYKGSIQSDPDGRVNSFSSFKTLELPRLVRPKPHAWDPQALLSSANSILQFIKSTISSDAETQIFETSFTNLSSEDGLELIKDWPIWRVSFDGDGELRVRKLEGVDRQELVERKSEDRVGFLTKRWVEGLREMRDEKGKRKTEE
jgi:RAT1-interacting protein